MLNRSRFCNWENKQRIARIHCSRGTRSGKRECKQFLRRKLSNPTRKLDKPQNQCKSCNFKSTEDNCQRDFERSRICRFCNRMKTGCKLNMKHRKLKPRRQLHRHNSHPKAYNENLLYLALYQIHYYIQYKAPHCSLNSHKDMKDSFFLPTKTVNCCTEGTLEHFLLS